MIITRTPSVQDVLATIAVAPASLGWRHGTAVLVYPGDGWEELGESAVMWTVGWLGLFYLISWTQPIWMKHAPLSRKAHENDRYWCARNMFGILHALFVAALSLPPAVIMLPAPEYVRFAASPHLAQCAIDPHDEQLQGWGTIAQAVALAALAVVTFMVADLLILFVHKQWTVDYLVHHVAFIIAGTILRANCMLPFNGAVLLAMEASTPFLNYLLLYRNRGDDYKLLTSLAGSIFFVLFLFLRVGLNTYATVLLWLKRSIAAPSWVPAWELWFLLVALTAGAGVQLFWLPGIVRTFVAALKELLGWSDPEVAA